ncbi:hypothetical protein KFE25_004423 [Diacronema lutheri]|uniref:Sulfotransferase domain-containing protein n=1 Tax=Diacronema lutheri TaxID=2081491 RepID=A0A8J6C7X2_DIALT|nr:hypothetical protein KFE25_004423 [Diacronema lutheri]
MPSHNGAARALAQLLVLAVPAEAFDKLFFIGPMKTGTTTLSRVCLSKGYATCHGYCNGVNWATATTSHTDQRAILSQHDAFMDHGDEADYVWVASRYPTSRFILNTRRLKTWLVSKADHVRRTRVAQGCTPYGARGSCPSTSIFLLENSDEAIARWVTEQADHQDKVVRFFASSHALRQRFVVIDVEGQSSASLNLLLDWISRPRLASLPTTVPVLRPRDVPMAVARSHAVPPDENSNTHESRTRARVEAVLRRHNCTAEDWNRHWYRACAKAISLSLGK